jgi:hypothetical protein
LIISGSLSPPFRGEVVTLRYVDPSGSVTEKPLLVEKDGAYTDIVKPELLGTWKVSSSFTGEGYYLSSQSPTISFDVINETKNSVYMLTVATPTAGGSSSEVTYPIVYLIDGGEVTAMSLDKENKSLNIGIDTESESGTRMLKIELSRSVIDAVLSDYQVYLDGRAASFEEIEDDSDSGIRTLSIPFSAETKRIQIIGTYVVPEFTTLYVFAAALISVTAAITFFHRRSNRQRYL